MRRFVLFVLFCLVPVVVLPSYSLAKKQQLHSIQADFTQETHLKILIKPLTSHGTFAFQAPESLRWEYLAPLRSIMLMHNGKMEKLIEKDGHMAQENGMSPGSLQVVLPQIGKWLDGRFSDDPVFKTEQTGKRTIILTPKDQGLRSVISSIELHLGEQHGVMESVTIFEGPGAYTKLTFSHIILNRNIPKSTFLLQ